MKNCTGTESKRLKARKAQLRHCLCTRALFNDYLSHILFVVNTALLSVLSFSKLIFSQTWFSLIEIGGFLISFSLLINALVPRQVSVTPNPATIQSQIAKPANDYRQQLLRSFQKIYQSNQQRLDDVADSLVKASYTLWGILITALLHILATVLY